MPLLLQEAQRIQIHSVNAADNLSVLIKFSEIFTGGLLFA